MAKGNLKPETDIVHGFHSDLETMDLVAPIHMTSTHKFKSAKHAAEAFAGKASDYVTFIYARINNPTTHYFEKKMAVLMGCEDSAAVASGMAAISMTVLALAKPGDNFISCNSLYGGTFKLFNEYLKELNIKTRFISPKDCCQRENVEKLIDEKTRFLYIETPANPTLDIIDIDLWARVAKKYNLTLVVDNTFSSPYLQNVMQYAAKYDIEVIEVHSTTKYLNGHGDNIGGLIGSSQKIIERIKGYIHYYGPCMSPFNAWLILRGLKTLHLRMDKHSASAMQIAEWLEKHPKIEKVYYPGLKSDPGHAVAKRQMKKFGGMIAFEVKGGVEAGVKVMENVKVCALAVSLGDAETLIQHPASMTHSPYSKEDRLKAGITDGLIRLSVGLEDPDDIVEDLDNALKKV